MQYVKLLFQTIPLRFCNYAEELELASQPALGHHILVEKRGDRGQSEAELYQSAQSNHTHSLFPERD